MIRMKTDCGAITVDNAVYTNIAGYAATNCFGVKGMAVRSMTDGLVHLLRREAMSKGVKVTFHEEGRISIDLHIMIRVFSEYTRFRGCPDHSGNNESSSWC